MKEIQLTMNEIWMQTKPKIHKNKKKYDRNKLKSELKKGSDFFTLKNRLCKKRLFKHNK
jgi:hypothetical protein